MKIITPLALFFLLLAACSKKELAMPTPDAVQLDIKAYSAGDTLELICRGAVLATVPANSGFSETIMMQVKSDSEAIAVRKKGDGEVIGELYVKAAPFSQEKTVYFDGEVFVDNVEITPVTSPANMGFRVAFKTFYPHFYGGLVDIELFEQQWDMNTFEITYHPLDIIIPNVGRTFSGFYELPELVSTPEIMRNYKFRAYRAGTKEPIFTAEADLSAMADPQNHYGSIYFFPGESQLLMMDLQYDGEMVFDDFNVQDISLLFR